MTDELYNYIYDAMCWALEYMDTVYTDDNSREQYDKLDKAAGRFQKWYEEQAKEPLKDKLNEWLDVLNYWFEHVEDYGDRYPDMLPMVKKFSDVIDEMYNLTKGK